MKATAGPRTVTSPVISHYTLNIVSRTVDTKENDSSNSTMIVTVTAENLPHTRSWVSQLTAVQKMHWSLTRTGRVGHFWARTLKVAILFVSLTQSWHILGSFLARNQRCYEKFWFLVWFLVVVHIPNKFPSGGGGCMWGCGRSTGPGGNLF